MSLSSPTSRSGYRFSSDSSWPSVMMDEVGEDVFDDLSPCSPKPNCDLFSPTYQPEGALPRPALTRTRSISSGSSNGCQSPTYDNSRASSSSSSSVFATLPRRRKASMRKNLLKMLPGLNYSLEEEENTWDWWNTLTWMYCRHLGCKHVYWYVWKTSFSHPITSEAFRSR